MQIADLRNKVELCRQEDIFVGGGVLQRKQGVLWSWANITPKKGSTFSVFGAAVGDNDQTRTHVVTMRHRADIDVSNLAWLYEERRKSGPIWYKILTVAEKFEDQDWWDIFDVRIVEKGELSSAPSNNQDPGNWARI